MKVTETIPAISARMRNDQIPPLEGRLQAHFIALAREELRSRAVSKDEPGTCCTVDRNTHQRKPALDD